MNNLEQMTDRDFYDALVGHALDYQTDGFWALGYLFRALRSYLDPDRLAPYQRLLWRAMVHHYDATGEIPTAPALILGEPWTDLLPGVQQDCLAVIEHVWDARISVSGRELEQEYVRRAATTGIHAEAVMAAEGLGPDAAALTLALIARS